MLKDWGGPVTAVAMVWFTTHFGGGFASGNQLINFFQRFGWFSVFMPALSMAITSLAFYYSLEFARLYKANDYNKWAMRIYAPFHKILAPLFEVRAVIGAIVVTAVAFATTGSTLTTLTGMSYAIGSVLCGIIVFFLTIYGADFIRKTANVFAAMIVVGLLLTYGTVIVRNWGNIARVVSERPVALPFTSAVWSMLSYAAFQTGVGTWVAVADVITTKEQSKRAAILGFIVNGGFLTLAALGVIGFYPEINSEVVPTIYAIRQVGGGMMVQSAVSVLIILGAVSTAVNVVFGQTKRLTNLMVSRGNVDSDKTAKIASLIYVGVTFAITTFGLTALVQKGYGTLGNLALPMTLVPILFFGVYHRKERLDHPTGSIEK